MMLSRKSQPQPRTSRTFGGSSQKKRKLKNIKCNLQGVSKNLSIAILATLEVLHCPVGLEISPKHCQTLSCSGLKIIDVKKSQLKEGACECFGLISSPKGHQRTSKVAKIAKLCFFRHPV